MQWAAPDFIINLEIVVGNAGPHPRGSGTEWATPDLTQGAPKRSGQRRTSPQKFPSRVGSAGPQLPEDMPKICQTRMSEDMSDEMSEDMLIEISDRMSEKNVRKNVRRYVRKYIKGNIRRYMNRNVR